MIITSKRCFLNILTQLMDANTLLNATYYMVDAKSASGNVNIDETLKYDENGNLTVVNNTTTSMFGAMSRYHINYSNGELDPTPHITSLVTLEDTNDSQAKSFKKYLDAPATAVNVYNWLFKNKLKGNQLQILIISDDINVKKFGDIICNYLSNNFGVDITFIDPRFRPNIPGKEFYQGNKDRARVFIKETLDYDLLTRFDQAVSQCGGPESINNLVVFLNSLDCVGIVKLYGLIFPNEKLPNGVYPVEHLKQIIIGRTSKNIPTPQFENLYSTEQLFKMLEEYENNKYMNDDDYDLHFK